MRLKLDENLGRTLAATLTAAGHDAATVADQDLCGIPDERLFRVCREEARALVTLDLHFGDTRRFPLAASPGVILLRPRSQSRAALQELTLRLIEALAGEALGRLVVVSRRGVRVVR